MPEDNMATTIPGNLAGLYTDSRSYEPVLVWNYAVKGLLRRGESSVLYGPSNCGKSALVCHIGQCIVSGRQLFGARVKRGVVVHVGAEAPDSILDRMRAYPSDNGSAAPYIVRRSGVDLSKCDDVKLFIEELKQIRQHTGENIVLVVFDTLARSIGNSDENCAQSMTAIVNAADWIARTVKAHVMLVHHTGKDVERGGRGSSALRGAVDTELALTPNKTGSITLSQEKQRTMPKGESVFFRTETHILGQDEDGENRTTVQAVELSEAPVQQDPKKGGGNVVLLDAVTIALHIRSLTGWGPEDSFRPRDIAESLPGEIWGQNAPASRCKAVSRALEKLAERNPPVVEKVGDGWRIAARQMPLTGS